MKEHLQQLVEEFLDTNFHAEDPDYQAWKRKIKQITEAQKSAKEGGQYTWVNSNSWGLKS